jgi:hypothetical protein
VPSTQRHLVVDRAGIPLVRLVPGTNRHDSVVFDELLDAIPPTRPDHAQQFAERLASQPLSASRVGSAVFAASGKMSRRIGSGLKMLTRVRTPSGPS